MKKFIVCFVVLLMSAATTFAASDEREEDRVKDAGAVLKEILNIPDDIPHDLLDKAECVIILPSVSNEEAQQKYPGGWKSPKPYLRIVPQPK